MEAVMDKEWLTQEEAAKFLGLSPATLQSWRSRKKGPPYARFGRAVKYRLADLRAWAEAQVKKPE